MIYDLNRVMLGEHEYVRPGICFLGGGSSSQPAPGQTIVNQSDDPWSQQAPFLSSGEKPKTGIYQIANDAYNRTPKDMYQGPLTAGPTADQYQAQNLMRDVAQSSGGVGNSTIDLGQRMLAGDFLSPDSNPFIKQTVDAAINPMYDRFYSEVRPAMASAAKAQGAYGGSSHDFFKAQATEDLNRTVADTSAKIYYDNYGRERVNQMQAPGLINQGIGMNLIPSEILGQVGAQDQAWQQDMNNDALARYQMQIEAPWLGLDQYSGIVNNGSPGSSSSRIASTPTPSTFQKVLSGGIGGGAMGGMAGYQLAGATGGALAPWVGGGAILGGLLGGV